VNKLYYLSNVKKEVAELMARCLHFKQVKAECKHPGGLLQPILILEWKWEVISMDFITILPRIMSEHDYIMVMVDRLRKVAHFILVKTTYSASEVAQVFIMEIRRLHGVLKKIIPKRDARFTSKFWEELFVGLGTELALSATYHLQIDGQTKKVNNILEEMLRMYVMHQQRILEEYLPLFKFSYNNAYQ